MRPGRSFIRHRCHSFRQNGREVQATGSKIVAPALVMAGQQILQRVFCGYMEIQWRIAVLRLNSFGGRPDGAQFPPRAFQIRQK